MSEAEGSQDWLAAAQAALAEGGVAAVRVEVLAQRLGVTKGGFYRRYRDRQALLEQLLAVWKDGRIEAIRRQTELADGEAPAERLRGLVRLFAERRNAQGLSIELAIRQWARSDSAAARAAGEVDAVRLASVAALYRQLGFDAAAAQARGVLFYAFIFGQGLLFPDAPQAEREAMVEACADALAAGPA
jgi:AcrR family transcriptional regulator